MDPRLNNIPGYLHQIEVNLLWAEASKVRNGRIVELGSYLGKSTAIMASACTGTTKVAAVDLWQNVAMGEGKERNTFPEFTRNVNPWMGRVIPVRLSTTDPKIFTGKAAPYGIVDEYKDLFTNINLLFIDADHSKDAVHEDMMHWYFHVVKGGTILMHDYTEPTAGVKYAADAFFGQHKPVLRQVIGSILKVII